MNTRFQRVLAHLDFSATDERVLEYVENLVDTSGEMVLLYVVAIASTPLPVLHRHPDMDDQVTDPRLALEALASRAKVHCTVDVTVGGSAGPEIVTAASRHHVDLVVLPVHPAHGMQSDTIAQYVVRHSPVPVLCLPHPTWEVPPSDSKGVSHANQ